MNAPMRQLKDGEITFLSGASVLVGRVFQPASLPQAIIVLHGATGVPQGFYRAFAEWLAGQGFAVLTYDYRDFGRSATHHVRRSKATIFDWTLTDQVAAQAEAERRFPGVPLWVIGHSLGGLFLPWHEGAARMDRVITVASGLVHVTDHPWPYQAAARAFWYGPGAVTTGLLGYTPGRALGMGSDLPKGVYWQWREFCTTRYFEQSPAARGLPEPDWMALKAPLKIVAIADDVMVPPKAVWRLMQIYPAAMKRQLTLHPEPGGKIGHLGAFRRENSALWAKIIA